MLTPAECLYFLLCHIELRVEAYKYQLQKKYISVRTLMRRIKRGSNEVMSTTRRIFKWQFSVDFNGLVIRCIYHKYPSLFKGKI